MGNSDVDFMIGQSNCETRAECSTDMADGGILSKNMNGMIEANSPQVDMYTIEENIASKVRSEVDSVMATVETRV